MIDWLGIISLGVGAVLIVFGIALVFNIESIITFLEKILGTAVFIAGIVLVLFGYKLLNATSKTDNKY
jgi:hypothetical protein